MTLTRERWRRLEEVFQRALERPEPERAAFVEEACGGDPDLAGEVFAMLRADAAGDGPLDRPATPLAGEADPRIGTRVGAWRLVERIAEGGMGVVYRAERADGAFEQVAAVKLLRGVVGHDQILRFEQERRTLARLSHPNIARLLDGGATPEGAPYLVMEFVRGLPIDRWCERERCTVAARVALFRKVCRAVHHAHQSLIVHRDLKPGNVLVDEFGEPKLLDFGIASLISPEEGATPESTATRARLLTPEYASPEQVRGEPLTTASDVYSLGVMLYRLLTGRLPYRFDSPSPLLMARVVCEREPTRPSAATPATSEGSRRPDPETFARHCGTTTGGLRRALRGDLDRILLMALRKEPERRYGSALELAEDLERFLGGRPVAAQPDTLAYRTTKFVRRNALAVSLGMLVLFALVFGMVSRARIAEVARQERDAAREAETIAGRERDHARIEARSAHLISSFLADSFLTARSMSADELDEARGTVMRRAEQARRQFADDPHQRANILDALGGVLLRLESPPDAEALIQEAREIRARAFGPASLEMALSLRSIGSLAHARGDYEAAQRAFREAYDLHRALPDEVHTDVGEAANNLAVACRLLGRSDEALALHREALALRRADGDELAVAESLNNLGVLHLEQGDLEGAGVVLDEALEIRAGTLGDGHELTLQVLSNLAAIAYRRDESRRCEELLRRTVAGFRELRSAGRAGLGRTLTNLATLQLKESDLEGAAGTLRESLALQIDLHGPDHPLVASVHHRLASLAGKRERFAEARAALEETLRIRRSTLPEGHSQIVETLRDLGEVLLRDGDNAAAREALEEAHRLASNAGDAGDGDDAPAAELAATTAALYAEALAATGDEATAEVLVRDALPALEATRGVDHPSTVAARSLLQRLSSGR